MTAYCSGCGKDAGEGDHARCVRPLDPPRFCTTCGRKLKVQVLPAGWRATCVEHGDLRSG